MLYSIKIGNYLARELTYDDIRHVYWTDSRIILGYVNKDTKTFSNRIQQIRESSSPADWRHVRTTNNPADSASRGMGAAALIQNTMWWNGPELINSSQLFPPVLDIEQLASDDPEVQRLTTLCMSAINF